MAVVRQSRLKSYGHVMRKDGEFGIKIMLDVAKAGVVGGSRPCVEWRQQVLGSVTILSRESK